MSPAFNLQADSLPLSHQGSSIVVLFKYVYKFTSTSFSKAPLLIELFFFFFFFRMTLSTYFLEGGEDSLERGLYSKNRFQGEVYIISQDGLLPRDFCARKQNLL